MFSLAWSENDQLKGKYQCDKIFKLNRVTEKWQKHL